MHLLCHSGNDCISNDARNEQQVKSFLLLYTALELGFNFANGKALCVCVWACYKDVHANEGLSWYAYFRHYPKTTNVFK